MNSGGSARAARAALFALVCVTTGTVLHRLADGCDPGLLGPALALPLIWLGGYGLARRERSIPFVVLALGVAQFGLHFELGIFCSPGAGGAQLPNLPGIPVMPGMVEAPALGTHLGVSAGMSMGMPTMGTATSGMSAGASTQGAMHSTVTMLLAHLLAVVICGCWLGRGERAFFDLCRTVQRRSARAAARVEIALKAAEAAFGAAVSVARSLAQTPLPPRHVPPSADRWRPTRLWPVHVAGPRVLRGPPLPSASV